MPFATEAVARFERCRDEVVVPLEQYRSSHDRPGLDVEVIDAACTSLRTLWAAHIDDLLPTSRASGNILGGLARVSEDARILSLQMRRDRTGPTMADAIDHLLKSLPECLKDARRALGGARNEVPEVVREVHRTHEEFRSLVARQAGNDSVDVGGLIGLFKRYALNQASDREMVRDTVLDHFGRAASVRAASKRRQLELVILSSDSSEGLRRDALSYRATGEQVVNTYLEAIRQVMSGDYGGRAGAGAWMDKLYEQTDTWYEAQSALLEACGEESKPPPRR